MASANVDYRSVPLSAHSQHGRFDLELQQMPTSRATSQFSTSASLGGASDDQQDLLMTGRSFPPTGAATQAQSQKSSIQRPDRNKKRKLQGWRFGLAVSTSIATLVLFTNAGLLMWAALGHTIKDGIGTLHVGDCGDVHKWNLALHVFINALSSLLLGASNYAMQCLTSPTRRECDKTHARREWLDIGVAGIRNLTKISHRRRVLWILLAVSSIPIHLLFNSAVFKTLEANEYDYFVVSEDFLEGAPITGHYDGNGTIMIGPERRPGELIPLQGVLDSAQQRYLESTSSYDHFSPQECISIYGGTFVSGHSNLFLVTSNTSANSNFFFATRVRYLPGGLVTPLIDDETIWVCDSSSHNAGFYCDSAALLETASNWTIFGHKIDYCQAQRTKPLCKLEFSIHILVAVIVCNLIKSAAMLWTLLSQRENTLVTFGDAMTSWLDQPDPNTKHRCLMSKRYAFRSDRPGSSSTAQATTPPPLPFSRRQKHRWYEAVSPKRWALSMICSITTIVVATMLLYYNSSDWYYGVPDPLLTLGFGVLNPTAIIKFGDIGLVRCVMWANLPQLIVSFLYLMYNGLYTSMHMAHEYGGYAIDRKPLRVTTPRGAQRSTYWLQLPYTYGVPLISASATLHWLISQSIFLARVSVSPNNVQKENSDMTFSAVGYSPLAVLCTVVLGSCMLVVVVGMGFRKLPGSIPIAGSCSAALAAAAHRPTADVDAAVLPVKWGALRESEDAEGVGHCCFTSEEVTEPQEGKLYAGDTRSTVNGLRWRAGY